MLDVTQGIYDYQSGGDWGKFVLHLKLLCLARGVSCLGIANAVFFPRQVASFCLSRSDLFVLMQPRLTTPIIQDAFYSLSPKMRK